MKIILIKFAHSNLFVSRFKTSTSYESMKKTSKQQIWLGIEAFLENNLLLFHTPSKLNVLQ